MFPRQMQYGKGPLSFVQEKKRSIKHFDVGNKNVLNILPQIDGKRRRKRRRKKIEL